MRNKLLIVATCAAALAFTPSLDAAEPGDALPDLVSDAPRLNTADPDFPPGGLEHDTAHDRLLLRFDGFVHNAAPAPAGWSAGPAPGALEVRAERAGTGNAMVPVQRIYHETGASSRDDASRDTAVQFETADGHDHWHFMRAARYSLWDEAKVAEAAPSMKVGFCLEDTQAVEAPDDFPKWYTDENAQQPRRFCERSNPGALSVVQGLQPGFRDHYWWGLALQWIDVSDVQPGSYWLRSQVDPDDVVIESDESNPGAFADSAAVIPGYHAAAIDAGVVPAGDHTTLTLGAGQFGNVGARRFRIVDAPAHGTLDAATGQSFAGSEVVYTPDPGHEGPDSFTYAAFDADSPFPRTPSTATVSLSVARPAPSVGIGNAPGQMVVGSTVQFQVTRGFDTSALHWKAGGVEGGSPEAGVTTPDGRYTAPGAVPVGGEVLVSVDSDAGAHDERVIRIVPSPHPTPAPVPGDPPPPPPVNRPPGAAAAPPPSAGQPRPGDAAAEPPQRASRRRPLLGALSLGRVKRWAVLRVVPGRSGVVRVVFWSGRRRLRTCRAHAQAGRTLSCRITIPRRVRASTVRGAVSLFDGSRKVAARRVAMTRAHTSHHH